MAPEAKIILIPLFPLIGFLVNGLLGHRFSRRSVGIIATAMPALSFLVSLSLFISLLTENPDHGFHQNLFSWIAIGESLHIDFSLAFDNLSSVMCLVVTGVGSLIHLYSVGYMSHDRSPARYFAYLNLFTFAMLILVTADNLPLMFVGWEGVGLCSYLLIGFWYEDINNAKAGKKAFVVNRIGDFGFILGIFTLFGVMTALVDKGGLSAETVEAVRGLKFSAVNELAPRFGEIGHSIPALGGIAAATLICLFLFLGATGKSAQIPLYVWLPDAMAGPTPVSALIHAATMVTSGVYMIGRLNGLFLQSEAALAVVATVGALTALFAGAIALTQNDMKKILAYSTVSQLGYMFLAMGVAAFGAGIFHLMTHAFFKACLFLGAGSVMHAMEHAFHKTGKHGDPLDVQKMGGLRKRMPVTFWTMMLATVAIAGWPLTAGFFSKDEILWKALERGMTNNSYFYVLYGIGVLAAAVTAFYMFRMIALAFFGSFRGDEEVGKAVPESPKAMTGVLVVLAGLSLVGGLVWWPGFIPGWQFLGDFLGLGAHASVAGKHAAGGGHGEHHTGAEVAAMVVSVLLALGASGLGILIFTKKRDLARKLARETFLTRAFYKASWNKFWVDEVYETLFVKPIYYGAIALWLLADMVFIDGLGVNGLAYLVKRVAGLLRRLQSGLVNMYA
ncbi:MAG: NADH-quinone oxidoreductase subunit L, partial [Planctomycetota bacterium]